MEMIDKKQGTKWSGLLAVAMMAMGMAAAQAQTPAPTVFGIGTGMADPQGTLHVREHSHLPGVPSAEEVEAEGADLGQMNRLLLQKVEELTLYILL